MKINLKLKGFKYCSLNDKVYIIINGINMIKRGFDFLRKKYFEIYIALIKYPITNAKAIATIFCSNK